MVDVQVKREERYLDPINEKRVLRIDETVDMIPEGKGAILLLRHGERFQVPHGMSKQQTPLTKMGKHSARMVGEILRDRIAYITTSNMYSCVETALGVSMGAGYTGRLRTNPAWGLPGVFVEERGRAAKLLRDKGVIWTYQYMAKNPQDALPGMRSCYHGSAILVRDLHFFKIPRGEVAVYVTHDSLLACLIAGITRRPILPKTWPAYLEGFVLWVDDWKMSVANRGMLLPVTGPF